MKDEEYIKDYLDNLKLRKLDEGAKITRVALAVSEIPWGEGRTIGEVFEKGVGTCTGKHKVLQACFDQLGIKYEPVVCTFKWSEQGVDFPEELSQILEEGEWQHGHNFVKLQNGNYVDVTWDYPLEKVGFKSLPKDWNPARSFIGLKNIQQQWDGVTIDEKKSELINSLDQQTKERREKFLKGLIEWIDLIHRETT